MLEIKKCSHVVKNRTIIAVFCGILFFSIMLTSCSERSNSRNSDSKSASFLLSHDSLVGLFTEVQLIESYLKEVHRYNRKTLDSKREEVYGELFAKYKISKDTFYLIVDHFKQNPEVMAEIYSEILVDLGTLMGEVGHLVKQDSLHEIFVADSLAAAKAITDSLEMEKLRKDI